MKEKDNNKDSFESKVFFSKYQPVTKIGEGSFGKIYSAVNLSNNEKFALKLVIIFIIIRKYFKNLQ